MSDRGDGRQVLETMAGAAVAAAGGVILALGLVFTMGLITGHRDAVRSDPPVVQCLTAKGDTAHATEQDQPKERPHD